MIHQSSKISQRRYIDKHSQHIQWNYDENLQIAWSHNFCTDLCDIFHSVSWPTSMINLLGGSKLSWPYPLVSQIV